MYPVSQGRNIACIDIGGRGGPDESLRPIAEMVEWTVVEPDPDESRRIQQDGTDGWAGLHVLETGIGPAPSVEEPSVTRHLNLYRQRGCSSLLQADTGLASRYARDDYYLLDKTISVSCQGMDQALYDPRRDYSYLKIDIQGAELEAFRSGPRLLDQLVMIRTEVSFLPIYFEQPLFGDIHEHLRSFDFELLNFVEAHHWRRESRSKYPAIDNRGVASKGQLIHGDAVFVRAPETIAKRPSAGAKLVDLAVLAYAYGEVDLTLAALDMPAARDELKTRGLGEALPQLRKRMLAQSRRRARRAGLRFRLKDLASFLIGRRV